MFVVTVINFLLFSLNIGNVLATSIVLLHKALILDIEYPLSEKQEFVQKVLQSLGLVQYWSSFLPVRSNLSLL